MFFINMKNIKMKFVMTTYQTEPKPRTEKARNTFSSWEI